MPGRGSSRDGTSGDSAAARTPSGRRSTTTRANTTPTQRRSASRSIRTAVTRSIPARAGSEGFQDGVDLVNAVAGHPETGAFLARKLYAFFVNETGVPDEALIQQLAETYYASGFDMREVVRQLLRSAQFQDPANYWARYVWPAELVPRLIKDVGWSGFSAAATLSPLINMGQTLFEPPDVAGWSLGTSWFSTGTMLARMNFAATLAGNQRFALQQASLGSAQTPDSFLAYFLDRLSTPPLDPSVTDAMRGYLTAGAPWSGSASQVATKAAGLVHLIGASSEYQFG